MAVEILVALILVSLIVSAVAKARRRRQEIDAPLELEDHVPTFEIVTVGLQGSGKTLLLASMYHQLQTPVNRCYFLTAPRDDVLQLNHWFSEMADTASAHAWPRGTTKGQTRQFTFTVKSRVGEVIHTAFQLKYLEYAGELLTEPQEPGSTVQDELDERIRSAHSLIGVIDGYHIRQLLDGHPEAEMRLARTLSTLVPVMIEATCPVIFVITKWDLLTHLHPEEREQVRIVRELLMSHDHFRSLVQVHGSTRVVRLIPVSAVGPGFATIDSTGEIIKVQQSQVRPTHVEVPLSAVVPDMFDQVQSRIDREMQQKMHEEVQRRNQMTPREALTRAGVFATQQTKLALTAAFGPTAALASDVVVGMYLDTRPEALDRRRARAEQELDAAQQQLDEFLRARRRVFDDMRKMVGVLEERLPESRLSHER